MYATALQSNIAGILNKPQFTCAFRTPSHETPIGCIMCQTFSRAVRGIFEPWPQIESKTMSKLRHPSRSQVLRDYLDKK